MISQKISEKFTAFVDDVESLSKDAWEALQKQTNFILSRLDDESLKKINQLMVTGAFKNRAEVVRFLIKQGLETESERFSDIDDYATQIEDLELKLQNIANGI